VIGKTKQEGTGLGGEEKRGPWALTGSTVISLPLPLPLPPLQNAALLRDPDRI